MKTDKKQKKSIISRIGFFVLIVYVVFMLVDMQVTLAEQHEELVVLQSHHEIQRIQNKDLKRQIEGGVDEEEVERVAREQLEYVAPNEKVFIDISGS